jgi:uncharacterized phage-associated protein
MQGFEVPPARTGRSYAEPVAATSAAAVAAEIRRRLPTVYTVQLHKLLYYCQGHYLQHHDEPLFSESIMAYDMGPIQANLWWAERNGHVDEYYDVQPLPAEAAKVVAAVVDRYGSMTGAALIDQTHRESPWLRANAQRTSGGSVRIETDWIRDWFRSLDEPMSAAVRALVDGAEERKLRPARQDDLERLRARTSGD